MFDNQSIANLSELEMGLYKYIVENGDKVVYMRIRELAQATHVSTASILRFCKHFNCDGFSDFKAKLKIHLNQNKARVIRTEANFLDEFVERTLRGDLDRDIDIAARLIVERSNTIFAGIGNSGHIAGYGARYLSSFGKFALYLNDPYYPMIGGIIGDSVTVALSVSGETEAIMKIVRYLKERGSKVISITNSKNSTLARMSDHSISYYITKESYYDENQDYRDITSQIPATYIVETLARRINELINFT